MTNFRLLMLSSNLLKPQSPIMKGGGVVTANFKTKVQTFKSKAKHSICGGRGEGNQCQNSHSNFEVQNWTELQNFKSKAKFSYFGVGDWWWPNSKLKFKISSSKLNFLFLGEEFMMANFKTQVQTFKSKAKLSISGSGEGLATANFPIELQTFKSKAKFSILPHKKMTSTN